MSSVRRPMPLNEHVTAQMKKMGRRDTKPELSLRRELHSRGLRFRVHARLPGRPDIVFSRARLAVFVDGCFWHGCPEHGVIPKNNHGWWLAKFAANADRDRRKDEELADLGWSVIHVWEHEDILAAADRVEGVWRSQTDRPRAR